MIVFAILKFLKTKKKKIVKFLLLELLNIYVYISKTGYFFLQYLNGFHSQSEFECY